MQAWSKPNRIATALGLTALACGAAIYYVGIGYFAAASEPPQIKKQSPASVAALGRIEPRSEIVNLGAGVSPDRLDSLTVARGDFVKKGQVLGYLGGYAEQMAQLDMYRAQLDEARKRLETEVEFDRARIDAAEVHQRQIEEVSPQRIAAQQASIASLEAKLGNDNDILTAQVLLFSQGSTSRRLSEDQKAMVAQDKANLASARARLSELQHQFEVDRIDARVQLSMARAQLERAQAEVPIASLERRIVMAEAHARRLMLLAPIDGRILNIRILPGEDVGNGPVLTMGDTNGMRAVAEVYETDISQVRIGQPATISSRALHRPVSGKVAQIGNMVFKNDVLNVDPAARADARVIQVWIDLDEPKLLESLTDLTVVVIIKTDESGGAVASSGGP
ncbi:MAG TPA: efflux RND transporter periplasmic adaptor subunit [Pseudolabrys sp.]